VCARIEFQVSGKFLTLKDGSEEKRINEKKIFWQMIQISRLLKSRVISLTNFNAQFFIQ
jgi:hypothetical protein